MKKNVSPTVALVAVLITLGGAGFALWFYGLREHPRPEHVGLPGFLQKMEDGRNADFKKKLAEQGTKKGEKPKGSDAPHAAPPAGKGSPDGSTSGSKGAPPESKEGN